MDDDGRRALRAFGLNLKLERVKRGLTQAEFADLLGMHRTFIGQLERGQRGCHILEFIHMVDVLGVRPEQLLPQREASENVGSRAGSGYGEPARKGG